MDFGSVITIIVAALVVYFFAKFIISPIIRLAVGIVAFLLIIYALQYFFGFDLSKVFGPYAVLFDVKRWGINLDWLFSYIKSLFEQIAALFYQTWQKVPQNFKQ